MSRSNQRSVTVMIDGEPTGVWDKKTGGGIDSEETKYPPGGMGQEIPLGGRRTRDNITLQRLFKLDRDLPLIKTWDALAGRAECVVNDQPLDNDGNPFGSPLVYTGVLKAVAVPDHDSESDDAALVSIEISTGGTLA